MTEYKEYLDAVKKLLSDSDKSTVIVAIDGKCGSGKSTLGEHLSKELSGNLFHMDDFYLQEYQRTKERLSEVGGNVDYERFASEVLACIKSGRSFMYRPYSCGEKRITEGYEIAPKRLNIIEGSYSHHPYFNDEAGNTPYDMKIFLAVPYELRIERIRKRNGEEKLKRFISEWIPKEEAYFKQILGINDDLSRIIL